MNTHDNSGAIVPTKMPTEWFSAIEKMLRRHLSEQERGIVLRAYRSYADTFISSDVVAEIVLPGITSANGGFLQLDRQALSVHNYGCGVPDSDVVWELAMVPMLIANGRRSGECA